MDAATALPAAVSVTGGTTAPSAAELARRGQIEKTAKDFEATFLAQMFNHMFEGTDVAAPFGGGPGEEVWRSVLTDAMAKSVTRAGGVGIADSVRREMLRLQGLS